MSDSTTPPSGEASGAPPAGAARAIRASDGGAGRKPGALDRRAFVGACTRVCAQAWLGAGLGHAALVTLLGGCASLVARPVRSVNGRIELALAHYPELAEPGGSLKLLPDGAPDPLYVLALGEGRYSVLSPICTHLGCTVEPQGAVLVCPCHGSTYDREGTVLQGPAQLPLRRFGTSLSADGVLVIALEAGT